MFLIFALCEIILILGHFSRQPVALVEAVRDLVSFFGGFRQGLQLEKEEEVLASPAFPDRPSSSCLMGKGSGWGGGRV